MADSENVATMLQQLVGKPVWFANAGGGAGSSFSLSLGRKLPRSKPLQNESVSDEFRTLEGEATLYVWCSWRLEGKDSVASSDGDPEAVLAATQSLVGRSVDAAQATGRCLTFGFRSANSTSSSSATTSLRTRAST